MSAEQHRERPCPPNIQGYIAQMESLMHEQQYNHAGMPIQLGVDLWRIGQVSSFAQVEDYFRQMNSRVYFFGVPLDFFGKQYVSTYPVKTITEKPEFTLYAAVNGPTEAAEMRERLRITSAENRRRLLKTGVVTV